MGAPNRVTSTSSERVTRVRVLHTRSGRRKAGLFVVEGPPAVRSALAHAGSAGVHVRDLFVDEDAGSAMSEHVEAAERAGARVTWVTGPVMAAMAETERPQGVLAVCDLLPAGSLADVMTAPGPVLVLEAVTDPGNVGTVIRAADAVGCAGVLLSPGCADVHNGKVVRSTAGSLFHLPVLSEVPLGDVISAAHLAGRRVAAATGDGELALFRAADSGAVDESTVWIVGSEAHGVSDEARAGADVRVSIPMDGEAESLNAAVAAAVLLYVTRHARDRWGGSAAGMTD